MDHEAVVRVQHLRKVYDSLVAVEDVSFQVQRGEIFGMVGPNGAGKTTTIECIEGLRRPDGGQVEVLGLDPQRDEYALSGRIGVQLQESQLQDHIRVWEALDLFAALYAHSIEWPPLLEQLGLADRRNSAFAKLSGGEKQRLFVALALVHDPDVVFLDELTTGLDPRGRHALWDLVREIRGRGKTIFLTTHYMEEAERLCDRVAIMDHGRIVALDSPENLIQGLGVENRIVFTVEANYDGGSLAALPGVARVEQSGERVVVYGHGREVVGDVVNVLTENNVVFRDLRTEQPDLEDVFLTLTGREMEK
ncbi:MAG: multidrug ABC transporter ATP-binding protein [Chloroflexi bacterium RBG_13_56_8]|nr:MAG: multidrug ABC transporter ATP-binding protein [Chloroflexi bacterium RBG_13_56_8]